MKTYYSILSLNITPEINERLSVGMIMVCRDTIFFHYSQSKLSIIKKIISNSTYKAALDYLKLIHKTIDNNAHANLKDNTLGLKVETKYSRILNESYFDYLSRYNNNLILFSKPKALDIDASQEIFKKLFKKLVDEFSFEPTVKKDHQLDLFKRNFFPSVKTYFNTEQEIDFSVFQGLYTPVKVDLLGKNDIEVFGQSVDFEKNIRSIEYNIGNLLQINKALPKAKQFVLGIEPNKKNKTHHQVWKNIQESKDFEYVELEEAEKIKEYAIEHGVKPFFD